MRRVLFISHPEVVVSMDVPVTQWPLSVVGRARMHAALVQPWIPEISAVYCSTEQKAIDAADILSRHLSLSFTAVHQLGENDRSATGFLPPEEFELVADQFFAKPFESVRGWERASAAQQRIVDAVISLVEMDNSSGTIAIVSHGAVGTLLYCHLSGQPISRRWDQCPNGGGVTAIRSNSTQSVSSLGGRPSMKSRINQSLEPTRNRPTFLGELLWN